MQHSRFSLYESLLNLKQKLTDIENRVVKAEEKAKRTKKINTKQSDNQ